MPQKNALYKKHSSFHFHWILFFAYSIVQQSGRQLRYAAYVKSIHAALRRGNWNSTNMNYTLFWPNIDVQLGEFFFYAHLALRKRCTRHKCMYLLTNEHDIFNLIYCNFNDELFLFGFKQFFFINKCIDLVKIIKDS